jgi:hypothetical protein
MMCTQSYLCVPRLRECTRFDAYPAIAAAMGRIIRDSYMHSTGSSTPADTDNDTDNNATTDDTTTAALPPPARDVSTTPHHQRMVFVTTCAGWAELVCSASRSSSKIVNNSVSIGKVAIEAPPSPSEEGEGGFKEKGFLPIISSSVDRSAPSAAPSGAGGGAPPLPADWLPATQDRASEAVGGIMSAKPKSSKSKSGTNDNNNSSSSSNSNSALKTISIGRDNPPCPIEPPEDSGAKTPRWKRLFAFGNKKAKSVTNLPIKKTILSGTMVSSRSYSGAAAQHTQLNSYQSHDQFVSMLPHRASSERASRNVLGRDAADIVDLVPPHEEQWQSLDSFYRVFPIDDLSGLSTEEVLLEAVRRTTAASPKVRGLNCVTLLDLTCAYPSLPGVADRIIVSKGCIYLYVEFGIESNTKAATTATTATASTSDIETTPGMAATGTSCSTSSAGHRPPCGWEAIVSTIFSNSDVKCRI